MKDVSEYPNLFAELLARGWTETDLEKVAGLNLLKALRGAESVDSLPKTLDFITYVFVYVLQVRDQMAANGIKPVDGWIPQADLPTEALPCSTGEYKSAKLLTE